MALTFGTNCGFVETAPTGIPTTSFGTNVDGNATALKHTSPSTARRIVEIGWYCRDDTEEANFEVAIYADSGSTSPETLIGTIDATNAKGTDDGWKRVTNLDIPIDGDTIYWIAFQLDETASHTFIYHDQTGGFGYFTKTASALDDPTWNGGGLVADRKMAIYAVWETAPPRVFKLNFG